MKKSLLLMLIGFLLSGFSNSLLAQNDEAPGKDSGKGAKFFVKVNYPVGIKNIYKFTENTKVRRVFSDSTVKEFSREIIFFLNVRQPGKPENNFVNVDVTVDSVQYKFTEGDAVYEFNSQDENPGIMNFVDQRAFTVALGKDYTIIYSPYGEVAKVEGEKLDWLKNYVSNSKSGIDEVEKFLWLDGISKERLVYISDIKKMILPPDLVSKDSVWSSPFEFQADGISYFDTLEASITRVDNMHVLVEGRLKDIKAKKGPGRYYGINNQLLEPAASTGSGIYQLTLSPRGTPTRSELSTVVQTEVPVRNDKFSQTVTTKSVWELLIQYK